jgi:hypothetical protein
LLIYLATLAVAGSAAAQAPAKPTLIEQLTRAHDVAIAMLSSPKPVADLASDAAFFSKRFRDYPARRGLGWPTLQAWGKAGTPPAFGGGCKTSTNDMMINSLAKASSQAKGGPAPQCGLMAHCTAHTARETGCYEIEMEVCLGPDGNPQIDQVTGGRKYTTWDFKTPAKETPCTREAAKAR